MVFCSTPVLDVSQQKSEVVDVEALLAEVIDSLAPPPEFTVKVMPGMPTLMTERLPLEQVFANLISNGIKHNHRPDGQIVISVKSKQTFTSLLLLIMAQELLLSSMKKFLSYFKP
jgi:signal transduction histidine kinase